MKTNINIGDKIYYNGDIYEAIGSVHCTACHFWSSERKRCAKGVCTRYANTMEDAIIWRYVGPFKPIYLDSIRWSSVEQKQSVYDFYQREIQEYDNAIAGELSQED